MWKFKSLILRAYISFLNVPIICSDLDKLDPAKQNYSYSSLLVTCSVECTYVHTKPVFECTEGGQLHTLQFPLFSVPTGVPLKTVHRCFSWFSKTQILWQVEVHLIHYVVNVPGGNFSEVFVTVGLVYVCVLDDSSLSLLFSKIFTHEHKVTSF